MSCWLLIFDFVFQNFCDIRVSPLLSTVKSIDVHSCKQERLELFYEETYFMHQFLTYSFYNVFFNFVKYRDEKNRGPSGRRHTHLFFFL